MTATAEHRDLPRNGELEQALLGAILIDNAAFAHVCDFLRPPHFFEPVHQKIYEIAAELIHAGKLANPLTVKPHLPAADFQVASGLTLNQYLARLVAESTGVLCVSSYGKEIYSLSQRRELIRIGNALIDASHCNNDPQYILDAAKTELEEIKVSDRRPATNWINMKTWD